MFFLSSTSRFATASLVRCTGGRCVCGLRRNGGCVPFLGRRGVANATWKVFCWERAGSWALGDLVVIGAHDAAVPRVVYRRVGFRARTAQTAVPSAGSEGVRTSGACGVARREPVHKTGMLAKKSSLRFILLNVGQTAFAAIDAIAMLRHKDTRTTTLIRTLLPQPRDLVAVIHSIVL